MQIHILVFVVLHAVADADQLGALDDVDETGAEDEGFRGGNDAEQVPTRRETDRFLIIKRSLVQFRPEALPTELLLPA